MGFNEAAGYIAVALTALATGLIASRWGLRPEPFYLGVAFAALGLGISALFVHETHGHARHEAASHTASEDHLHGELTTGEVFRLTSFRERTLSACSQAGLAAALPSPTLATVPGVLRSRRAGGRRGHVARWSCARPSRGPLRSGGASHGWWRRRGGRPARRPRRGACPSW